jgi:hypothetical protein
VRHADRRENARKMPPDAATVRTAPDDIRIALPIDHSLIADDRDESRYLPYREAREHAILEVDKRFFRALRAKGGHGPRQDGEATGDRPENVGCRLERAGVQP